MKPALAGAWAIEALRHEVKREPSRRRRRPAFEGETMKPALAGAWAIEAPRHEVKREPSRRRRRPAFEGRIKSNV
jgi:hypothetical protein